MTQIRTHAEATDLNMELPEDTSSTFNECQLYGNIEKSVSSQSQSFSSVSSCAKNTSSVCKTGDPSHLITTKRPRNDIKQPSFEKALLSKLNELGEDDEYSSYGNYIAHELKSFSKRNQYILKHKIEQLIFEMRMNELGDTASVGQVGNLLNY